MTTSVPTDAPTPGDLSGARWADRLIASRWALLGPMAIALGLGVLRIGSKSLWLDEAVSARQTLLTWGERWDYATGHDVNMSLHHALIAVWAELGTSEAWLRLPSVAFTVGAVGLTYAVGLRVFDRSAALIGAVVLAVNPFTVAYSQEARGYTMAMFGAALASLLLLRVLEKPTLGRIAPWVVASALLPYAHFFGFLVVGAHAAVVLLLPHHRALRPRLLSGFAAVGALSAPLAWFIFAGGDRGQIAWIEPLSPVRLLGVFPRLTANDNLLLTVVAAAVAAAALVATSRAVRADGWRGRAWWPWAFSLSWLVLPIIAGAAVSLAKPIFVARYFIVSSPALALVLAGGITTISRMVSARGRLVGLALLVVASGWGLLDWYSEHPKENWRRATMTVLTHAEEGDAVTFLPQAARIPFEWYAERADRFPPTDLDPAYPDLRWGPFLQGIDIPRLDESAASRIIEDSDRVWIVARLTANGRESAEVAALRDQLATDHEVVKSWRYVDVRVTLFERA